MANLLRPGSLAGLAADLERQVDPPGVLAFLPQKLLCISTGSVFGVAYRSFWPRSSTQATVFLLSMSKPIYLAFLEPLGLKGSCGVHATATNFTVPTLLPEAPIS
jgi:hypothetical protein